MRGFSPDILYLTATGRLARRFRHEYRTLNLSRGKSGWEALNALSLNDWLQVQWSESWPEETPAHLYHRLRLFSELTHEIPPPASLETDLQLCRMLDDTYVTLIRHELDPCSGYPSNPLVEWRRQISRRFKENLASTGQFHPAELPSRIARGIEKGSLSCPDRTVISGFDFPAPVEINLFRVIKKKASLTATGFPDRMPDCLEAIALPSLEQEIQYLIGRIVEDARSIPLHRIGVVTPNLDTYADALEKYLKSISGEAHLPDTAFYNISLGKAVVSFPLIRAALLPLQMALEGTTRTSLLALLLSPYYSWGSVQNISRADLVWRKFQAEDGLRELLDCLGKRAPEILKGMVYRKLQCLSEFTDITFSEKRPLAFWLEKLLTLWSVLGFPVLSDEKDSIACHHLKEILKDMRTHLDGLSLDGFDLLSWLHFAAAGSISQTAASEEAGIQILGLIESRGHDFDRLYVLGMSDRSLPQPVRPLPFLDTAERKKVLGATPESQYAFAEKSFKRLLSSSPIMTLLRPEQADMEPLSPSPFWPGTESKKYVDLWNDPGPVWLRAGWLRSAFHGLKTPCSGRHDSFPATISLKRNGPADRSRRLSPLPRSLSVSGLEKAVTCPVLFFLEDILGITPLKDPLTSIYLLERGERLHRVLSLFTREARRKKRSLDMHKEAFIRLLTECVDRTLHDVADQPRWFVERRLWLEEGGLLLNWLDMEIERWKEGWVVLAEEISFQDLKIPGLPFTLKGRIDRLDYHPDHGILCWDYKSGSHPGKNDVLFRLTAPQLPIYLMALRKGAVSGLGNFDDIPSQAAGYVQMKSPGEIRTTIIGGESFDWEVRLADWERLLNKMGTMFHRGDFPAQPFPFSRRDKPDEICTSCMHRTLCEKGLIQDAFDREVDDFS